MRQMRTMWLAVATAAALLVPGCAGGTGGDSGDGPVTLTFTWWGNDDRAGFYKEALKLFEKKHPEIKVNGNFSDWDAYWTARSTEVAGRSLPDVMQFDLAYLREYAENGHLLDLSPYIGKQIDLSGFNKGLVKSGAIDGQQIGVPISTNTLALFVNSELIEKADVKMLGEDYTWDEYNEWLRSVTEAGAKTKQGKPVYGGVDYAGTAWVFFQWLLQQGVQPFKPDGTFNFTQDHVRDYLNLSAELRSAKAVYPQKRSVQVAPLDGFAVGESASSMTWDNFLTTYAAETGAEKLEMLPLPTGPNGTKAMFWKPSMLMSASANTEHPEEAALLVDFLLTDPEVGKIFGTSRGVPADKGQREAMDLKEGSVDAEVLAYEKAVADQVTEPTPVPVRGFGTIEAEWLRLNEDLQYGKITVDEFVDRWWSEAEMATQ